MTTPKALSYSTALKPVSIPVAQQSRKFLPISAGPYNTANSIIRIPINSNAFLDLKNLALKFQITNKSTNYMFLDGNASSIIRRLEILSPDGQSFEVIDNYSRLYNALVDVERSIDNREGYGNLLEGASNDDIVYGLASSATAGELHFLQNGIDLGFITVGAVGTFNLGPYQFATSATANQITVTYGSTTITLNTTAAATQYLNGISFRTTGTAAQLNVNGSLLVLGSAGSNVVLENRTRVHTARMQSELFAAGETKFYTIPLLSCITKLDVLYPAFLVGGGGVVLQITVPSSNDEVFFSTSPANAPIFEVSGVELIIPVLQYSDAVVSSLKQMVQQLGTFSMSSYTFKNFTYPYSGGQAALSIPIAVRVRSLKALYFFFQSTQSANDYSIPRVSARENVNLTDYQLRVGSMYYPASKVKMETSNPGEVIVELLKSVSKLNDMRLGTYINKKNFYLPQSQGGLQVFGIDLEGLQNEYMESGLNTSENALQTFLEVTFKDGSPPPAGNCQIFAFYDNSISILSNGNILATY